MQIARGLAAAHAKGVVHRDLKPDNLFLTTDEHIKILDFGIAKLKADSASDDVTIGTSGHDTKAGIVVGTVGYMSPEQVRGESLDHRSDLFAVGAILYELVTGRRAFQAETVSETMTAILRDDPPPVSEIVPIVPPAFEAILAHCLVKDRSSRVQSALDLALDIELVSMLSDRSAPARDAAAPAAGSRRRPALVGLGLIVAAAAGLLFGRTFAPAPSRSSAVGVHRLTDLTGLEEYPSLSPDRKYVAFTADADGARQIWVRLLSGGSPLRLTTGAADHLFPRWAPDSGSIVYFSSTSKADSSGSLWEVSARGGAARKIACSLGGADVSHDGRLAFFRLNNDRPERAIAGPDGSGIETVVVLEAGFVYQTAPQ